MIASPMNRLSHAQRVDVLNCLVNGNSMRATTRITGVSYTTIAKLLRNLGPLAWKYHDEHVRGVDAKRLQCDEVWAFVSAKRKTAQRLARREAGDVWTWLALDPDTKLLVSYLCGPRTLAVARVLLSDAGKRLVTVPEVYTDGLIAYHEAVVDVWGEEAPYTRMIFNEKTPLSGWPDLEAAGTSFVERLNLSLRMENRRFARKTNAFSKRVDQHFNNLAVWAFYYNWVRIHQTLKTTPAVEASIATRPLSLGSIVDLLDGFDPTS